MKKFKLIYNPRCSKSNEALEILKSKGVLFEEIDYMSGELSAELLLKIKRLLNKDFVELVRQKEAAFSEFIKLNNIKESDWLDFILKNPEVLERPIFFTDEEAIIARPPQLVCELL